MSQYSITSKDTASKMSPRYNQKDVLQISKVKVFNAENWVYYKSVSSTLLSELL